MAKKLMVMLEDVTINRSEACIDVISSAVPHAQFMVICRPMCSLCRHNAYFVDLFVRVSNVAAINMYKSVSAAFEIFKAFKMRWRHYFSLQLMYYSCCSLGTACTERCSAITEMGKMHMVGRCLRLKTVKTVRCSLFPPEPTKLSSHYCDVLVAADMRKAMPRDVEKRSVIPLSRPVRPHELEFD